LWGHLDLLINNAAMVGPIGKSWEINADDWRKTIQVNLIAPVELCNSSVAWMKERQRGKIINLSGGGAASPRPNFSAYSAAKAALVRFTEILAAETRDLNIQVNCVAPGILNTDMQQVVIDAGPLTAGEDDYNRAINTAGTTPDFENAVDLCVFLASEEANFITGKLISATWDRWKTLSGHREEIMTSDIYTLRRIVPSDRGKRWE
jgi:3-oxoacyl-[acyl-carrier protein] reductase